MLDLTQAQIDQFHDDGFLIIDQVFDPKELDPVVSRYEKLFRGEFETGVQPDEWNWREGRDSPELTRQICNGWKSDRTIAGIVFREEIGRACATLAGWPGARLQVDNVLWKPPGARPLGFHQDCSYLGWLSPQEMLSCWIALDDTSAEGGTVLHVRGSHKWGKFEPIEQFHGPEDYMKEMRTAAERVGKNAEVVPVVVRRGGIAFHNGWTWHGSGFNRSERPRRSLVVHTISSEARFNPARLGHGTGGIYARYKRVDDNIMDDHYFPILWTKDGGRSKWLDAYMRHCPAPLEAESA